MIKPAQDWNPLQARLKEWIKNKNTFNEAKELCLKMHASLHSSKISRGESYDDKLWDGLEKERFSFTSPKKYFSIAWNIWHITRIEDITANILMVDEKQVFDESWKARLGVSISDTGNAMTVDEIVTFSASLNMEEMKNYRLAVGQKTQKIINTLEPDHLKKTFSPEQLQRLLDEGALLGKADSKALLTFWGKMNVTRVLLLPITRHQVVHLNDAFRIKMKKMPPG